MEPITETHLFLNQQMLNGEQNQFGRKKNFTVNYGLWEYKFRLPSSFRPQNSHGGVNLGL